MRKVWGNLRKLDQNLSKFSSLNTWKHSKKKDLPCSQKCNKDRFTMSLSAAFTSALLSISTLRTSTSLFFAASASAERRSSFLCITWIRYKQFYWKISINIFKIFIYFQFKSDMDILTVWKLCCKHVQFQFIWFKYYSINSRSGALHRLPFSVLALL